MPSDILLCYDIITNLPSFSCEEGTAMQNLHRITKKILSYLLVSALILTILSSPRQADAAKKIRLNKKKTTIYVGKKVKLKLIGTKRKAKWKSKKEKIATVSKKGVVKGKRAGKTVIIAKLSKKSYSCKITVKKKAGPKPTGSKQTSRPVRSPLPSNGISDVPSPGPSLTATPTVTATSSPTATPLPSVPKAPVFSKGSGSYDSAFDLTLTGEESSTIYYTTDGSIPLSKEGQSTGGNDQNIVSIPASTQNKEFAGSVKSEDVSDGVKLTFSKQYQSICFKSPEGTTDWSDYDGIRINYTVHSIGNSTKNTLGLQIAPIHKEATSSWDNSTGVDTARVWEERRSVEGSGTLDCRFNTANKQKLKSASVGRLMLGVFNDPQFDDNTWDGQDVITIHSIQLYKGGSDEADIPAKQDTHTYTGPISIKDRDNDPNLLCSSANIPYMYDPAASSPEYPNGTVPKATVIRAIVVRPDGKKSKVATKVYFVGKDLKKEYKNASVVSIVTDPDNLLSETTGIYRYGNWDNSGQEWEREADVTYIDTDGTIPFETTVGIRIHGGYSRKWGQKSFRLYFREEYGLKNLKDYPLIPGAMNFDKTEATTKYKKLILRNGGNDYSYTKLQDVWIQSLVDDRAFTVQSARPCVLFLNGEYWGLYNLTERYSDNYIETEFGVDKDNVIMIKNEKLEEGTEADLSYYDEMQSLADLDMSDEDHYRQFTELVDEQSYLDYYATEIYIGNNDWPDNNKQLWRSRTKDGTKYGDTRWRYMLYDTEFSMNIYNCESNPANRLGTDIIERTKSKDRLFRALCVNAGFRKKLADTLMELANNNFEVSSAESKLDSLTAIYRPLMIQYYKRFSGSVNTFDDNIQRMKTFLEGRKTTIQAAIQKSLSLS